MSNTDDKKPRKRHTAKGVNPITAREVKRPTGYVFAGPEDATPEDEIAPSSIEVGERFRKDFGDIEELAASIKEIGLLQPIGVTKDLRLVFGERRLRACQSLKMKRVPVRYIDIDDIIFAEDAENRIRKPFAPSEALAIADAIQERLGNRSGAREDITGKPRDNWPEVGERSADFAAERAGLKNRKNLERVRAVTKTGVPELVAMMDREEVKPSAAAVVAALPEHQQRAIVANGPKAVPARASEERKKAKAAKLKTEGKEVVPTGTITIEKRTVDLIEEFRKHLGFKTANEVILHLIDVAPDNPTK